MLRRPAKISASGSNRAVLKAAEPCTAGLLVVAVQPMGKPNYIPGSLVERRENTEVLLPRGHAVLPRGNDS